MAGIPEPRPTRRAQIGVAAFAVVVAIVAPPTRAGAADDSISDFFSTDGSTIQRLARQQEESVAACMTKKGFTYKVVGVGQIADIADVAGDPEKFADKYGYGVTTLIDPNKAGKPAEKNANEVLVAKMSASEKKAYNKALLGAETAEPSLLGNGGCVGESTKKLFASFAKLQALGPQFEEIQKRVDNDKSVLEGMKKWSTCMKDSGYTFRSDSEPPTSLQKELSAISTGGGSGAAGGAAGIAGALTVDASKIDATKLRALQKKEMSTSKADRSCTKKHLVAREAIRKVEEKKFIDKNRTVLEAVRKDLGGGKK
jgi:hypothetical protein